MGTVMGGEDLDDVNAESPEERERLTRVSTAYARCISAFDISSIVIGDFWTATAGFLYYEETGKSWVALAGSSILILDFTPAYANLLDGNVKIMIIGKKSCHKTSIPWKVLAWRAIRQDDSFTPQALVLDSE